jgi:integrase
VALTVEDMRPVADGLHLVIRRSKTDQEGAGEVIGIPRCNVETCGALRAWLDAAGISSGPVFRHVDRHGRLGATLSGHAVAVIVKRRAQAAGLAGTFSGHSLRAGMITSAAAGAADRDIQRQSRHKSQAMMQRYIRPASVFHNNVAQTIGCLVVRPPWRLRR